MPVNGWVMPNEVMQDPFTVAARMNELTEQRLNNRIKMTALHEAEEQKKEKKDTLVKMQAWIDSLTGGQQGQTPPPQQGQQAPPPQRPPQQPQMAPPQLPQGPQSSPPNQMMQRPQGMTPPPNMGQPAPQAQPQGMPPQMQQDPKAQAMGEIVKNIFSSYKSGNREALQDSINQAKYSGLYDKLPPMIKQWDKTGPLPEKSIVWVKKGSPETDKLLASNPELKDKIGPDGPYEVEKKGSFYTEFKYKHIATDEKANDKELIKKALSQELGREPTPREILSEQTRLKVAENQQKLEGKMMTFEDLNPKLQTQMDHIIEMVASGKLPPKDGVSQAFKTFGVNASGAFMTRFDTKHPSMSLGEMDANYAWFKNPQAQRLFRRTDSVFEALEESKRLASLVDNPAGTPINKLTGSAKMAFGDSKRALLGMGNLFTADEANQIFGSTGGAVQYFTEISKQIDPNMSVEQYTKLMDEAAYYIGTRQKSNIKGTPLEPKWESRLQEIASRRPYLDESRKQEAKKGGIISEQSARAALTEKGVTVADQDKWIKKYRDAGKIQ